MYNNRDFSSKDQVNTLLFLERLFVYPCEMMFTVQLRSVDYARFVYDLDQVHEIHFLLEINYLVFVSFENNVDWNNRSIDFYTVQFLIGLF